MPYKLAKLFRLFKAKHVDVLVENMKRKKPLIITIVSLFATLLLAVTSFAAESGYTTGIVSELSEDSMSIQDG